MTIFYKRNTNIYISKNPNASADATNTVQLRVKDFSYNQSSRVESISRNTLDPSQDRTLAPHIPGISPVSFSLTTYVLSVVDTNVTSPEEYLWISLMGADILSSSPTESTIDFADGNVAELPNLTIWFKESIQASGNHRLDNCIIDSADIKFDINGIAEIVWTGRALSIVSDDTPASSTDRTGITNYIKNKFSTISLNMNSVDYILALTGGSIRFNNNNTFYGRIKMGETTVPVGHYTGNRTITGNLDFYKKSGTDKTVDLFNELLSNVTNIDYEATHLALITIIIGGASNTPRLTLTIPQALLSIPSQEFGETYKIKVPFIAKEETSNYTTITYTT